MISSIACHILLLSGQPDSTFYQVRDRPFYDKEHAIEAIFDLVKFKCNEAPKIEQASCKYLVPDNKDTFVCYIEVDMGYFFVTKDMLDNMNIVYNRWD